MFTEETVIIVGAGASVEFGLPSGKDVYSAFERFCESLKENHYNFSRTDKVFNYIINESHFHLEDIKSQAQTIAPKLQFQFNTSIDEFLYDNKSATDIGKLYSAYTILEAVFRGTQTTRWLQSLDTNSKNHEYNISEKHLRNSLSNNQTKNKNWLASLTKILTDECEDVSNLSENKITIVTFNYDNYVEQAILSFLSSTERFEGIENCDFLPILHVNGCFEHNRSYSTSQEVRSFQNPHYRNSEWEAMVAKNASNIYMVKEDVCEKTNEVREQARKAISKAQKVYMLGFACDPRNVSLIGLDKVTNRTKIIGDIPVTITSPEIYGLNYDGDIALNKKFEAIGVKNSQITGSANNKMACSRAAELGFFSQ